MDRREFLSRWRSCRPWPASDQDRTQHQLLLVGDFRRRTITCNIAKDWDVPTSSRALPMAVRRRRAENHPTSTASRYRSLQPARKSVRASPIHQSQSAAFAWHLTSPLAGSAGLFKRPQNRFILEFPVSRFWGLGTRLAVGGLHPINPSSVVPTIWPANLRGIAVSYRLIREESAQ